MSPSMKQTIRDKVKTYLQRAEEIKDILKTKSPKKQPVANGPASRGGSAANKVNEDENEDPDRKRMMQKFEGQFSYIYVSHINIVVSL